MASNTQVIVNLQRSHMVDAFEFSNGTNILNCVVLILLNRDTSMLNTFKILITSLRMGSNHTLNRLVIV